MLTLVMGPPGSGKSTRLLEQIRENAGSGVAGQLLLVPEQFSHDMERRLAAVGGAAICRYAEVLSFTRLATRVFSAEGGLSRQTLDGGGQLLSMTLALETVRSRLRQYGAASARPAFYTELLSAVQELKSYAVTAQRLHQIADEITGEGNSDSLTAKLEDLALILESYDAVCARGKPDPQDQLSLLAGKLASGSWAAGRSVFVDGFSDFTALELQLLEVLLGRCRSMTVALTCDGPQGNLTIYETVRRTAESLKQMAARMGVQVRTEYTLPAKTMRPAFRYLNENLFRAEAEPAPVPSPELKLVRADSLREECQTAVYHILELIHAGARYGDIAVAVTDPDSYGPLLQGLCEQYEIPLYRSGTQDILQKPVVVCITAALSAAVGGMETEDVLRYLKTGLSPLDQDTCDILENYAVVWNLRGSRWASPLKAHPDGYGQEMDERATEILARVNAGREAAVVPLLNLQTALHHASSAGESVLALYRFIEQIGLESRLENLARELAEGGRMQEASEWIQLYGIVSSALEQFYGVLGDVQMEPARFSRLLEMQLSQYHVGTIPVTLDIVLCGTIRDLRNRRPQHLLVLGAVDGQFPAETGSSGILSEADRQRLELYQVSLAPGRELALNQEMAVILDVLSSPEQTLWVSCRADASPAFLFQRLCMLFPQSEQHEAGWKLDFCRKDTAAALLVRWEQENQTGAHCMPDLHALPEELPAMADSLRRRAAWEPGGLSPETVEKLWKTPIFLSASRLETYASCQYQFFLRYGLKAGKYERAEFGAPAFGTFVHYVLEHVTEQVMKEGGFKKLDRNRMEEITDTYITQYTAEEMGSLADQTPHFCYLYERNLAEVRRIVENTAEELRVSDFRPAGFELNFGHNADVPPCLVQEGDVSGEITGFVDREDLCSVNGEEYVRIVDYKTGTKEFDFTSVYYGVGLQMLIYLFALESGSGKDSPLKPAGVLYVPAQNTILASDKKLSPEEAEKERKKALKRSGILLNNEAVLQAMEHYDQEPVFLPSSRKKISDKFLMDDEQLGLLRSHVNRCLRMLLKQMADGKVEARPYSQGTRSPCSWCDYAVVCHPSDENRRYFKSRTYQEFWNDLRKREDSNG